MDPNENRIRKSFSSASVLCRVCHRLHEGEDVQVISQNPDVWMMVVECPDCHTRSFVAAVVDEKQADEAQIALRRLAGEHYQIHPIDSLIENDEAVATPADPLN